MSDTPEPPRSKLTLGDAERLYLDGRIAQELELAARLNQAGRTDEAAEAVARADDLERRRARLKAGGDPKP